MGLGADTASVPSQPKQTNQPKELPQCRFAQRHILKPAKLQQQSRTVLQKYQFILNGLWNDPSVKNDNNGWINLGTGKHN